MSQLSETAFPERYEHNDRIMEEHHSITQKRYLKKLGFLENRDDKFGSAGTQGPGARTDFGTPAIPSFDHWASAVANPVQALLPIGATLGLIGYSSLLTPLEIARVRQISPPATWPSYIPRPTRMTTAQITSSLMAHEGVYYLIRAFPFIAVARSYPIHAVAYAHIIPAKTPLPFDLPDNPTLRTFVLCLFAFTAIGFFGCFAEHTYLRIAHPAGHRLYGSMYDSMQRIFAQQGFGSLYLRGTPLIVLRETIYWTLVQAFGGAAGSRLARATDNGRPDPLGKRSSRSFAVAGAVGAVIAAIVTNPIDVVIARMFLSATRPPLTAWHTAKHLLRVDGWAGALRGVGPRMLWGIGVGGVFGSRIASFGVTANERHMIDTELSTDPRVRHLREHWYEAAMTPRQHADARLEKFGRH